MRQSNENAEVRQVELHAVVDSEGVCIYTKTLRVCSRSVHGWIATVLGRDAPNDCCGLTLCGNVVMLTVVHVVVVGNECECECAGSCVQAAQVMLVGVAAFSDFDVVRDAVHYW